MPPPPQAVLVLLSLAGTTLSPRPCPCPRLCARQASPAKHSHTGPTRPGAAGSTGQSPNSPRHGGFHSSRDHTSRVHRCTCARVYARVWVCILRSHLGSSLSRAPLPRTHRETGGQSTGGGSRGWGPWEKVNSPSAQPWLWPRMTSAEHEGHEDRPDSGTWEQRQRQRRFRGKGLTRWPLRPAVFRIL